MDEQLTALLDRLDALEKECQRTAEAKGAFLREHAKTPLGEEGSRIYANLDSADEEAYAKLEVNVMAAWRTLSRALRELCRLADNANAGIALLRTGDEANGSEEHSNRIADAVQSHIVAMQKLLNTPQYAKNQKRMAEIKARMAAPKEEKS